MALALDSISDLSKALAVLGAVGSGAECPFCQFTPYLMDLSNMGAAWTMAFFDAENEKRQRPPGRRPP